LISALLFMTGRPFWCLALAKIEQAELIHEIRLEEVGKRHLFKFSESLQQRMEGLLDGKKADQLTPDEMAELEAIAELDRIFTHMNAMLAAQPANE
jgi:hypothetical protein